MPKSFSARAFLALIIASGAVVLGASLFNARPSNLTRLLAFVVVACLTSRLKVKLPGLTGSMAVNLPFILIAIAQLGATDALLVGCLSTFTQCLPRKGQKFNPAQALFNVSAVTLAVFIGQFVFALHVLSTAVASVGLRLAVAAIAYFVANTVPVATIISLTERVSAVRTWSEIFQLSFPYLVASAGVAGLALTASSEIGWQVLLVALPVMVGIFHSYRKYFAATAEKVKAVLETEHQSVTMGAHA